LENKQKAPPARHPYAGYMKWGVGTHGTARKAILYAGAHGAATLVRILQFFAIRILQSWNEFSSNYIIFNILQRIIKSSIFIFSILHMMSCFADLHDFSLKRLKTPMKLHDLG